MKKKTIKLLKKTRLRTRIAFGVIFLLLPIIALSLFRPYNPKAAWADESWIYRVPLTFTHNAAVTNTKVKFDIDTATLITAGKMQSDCGDSRFTDLNGNNLPYYLDSAGGACNTNSTDYYVLVPSIVNGTNVIYHYYGNASAPNGTQGAQLDVSTTTPSGGAATTGTEENTPAPNGWWKFDQGSGTSTEDATQQNNDGTITEALWMGPERCVVNDCLWFDGSNDVVTVTNATQIDLNEGLSGGFTFEAWIRPNNAGEGTGGQVFNKGTDTWLKVASLSGGKLDLSGSLDLATTDATVTASAVVNANQWTHVAMSNAGSTVIKLWVNGQLVGTSSNGVGAFTADANNILIGGGTSNNFQGFIDEPKVYKSERTTAQMISDALPGQGFQSQGSTSRGKNISLSDGLVSWWKLDETASSATDNSGNANSGTWTGGAARVTALYYNGITLDGTGDYISAADSASLSPTAAVTIAAWVNPSSSIATKAIVVKDGSYRLVTDASGNPLCQINDGSWQTAATSSTALSLSVWQHVACTFDGRTESIYINGVLKGTSSITTTIADSANALRIGSDSGGTYGDFNGAQDEVRVYNKAMSGLSVLNLYKWAPGPDGWWKLDEGNGTTAADSSTNGFNGTITGTPTWTDGKYNKAILFDKASDQISAGDVLDMADKDNFTVELWVKIPASISGNTFVLSKKDTGDAAAGWFVWFPSVNQPEFVMADGTNSFNMNFGTSTFSLNTWYHLTVVVDEDSVANTTAYLNGVESKGDTTGTSTSVGSLANALNLRFASTASSYAGYIDDVRIYRYARNREQVQEDYLNSRLAASNNNAAGYWKLDETSGTTAYDTSTYGNNLTLSGSPTLTPSGKLNGALALSSASSQYGSVADNVALSIKGSLTVSAWIKPSSTTAATLFPIAGKAGGDVISYLLAQYGDEIRMYIGSSSNYVTTNASNLSTSTWYYVSGVYDETSQSVTIYINGRPQAATTTGTIPSSISDNADTFDIGRLGATTNLIYPVTANADDGTENTGTWDDTQNGDGFGNYLGGAVNGGLRYLSLAIPNAATITSAFIRVRANTGFSSGTPSNVHGTVYGDAVDSAPAWSSTSRPSSGFTNTTASANWDPTTWTNDTTYDSPDITSVVQELVNRAGWASGNNMRFAIKNNASSTTTFVGFDSYNLSHVTMSKLYVSYNTGGSASYYDGTIDEVKVYPMALSQEQVLVDQNFGSAASYSLGQDEANNLTNGTGTTYVGYYPIDENSGSATVYDHSGNGNDLTINGSIPKTAWQTGKIGSSLLLDGSNDTISRADDADFDFGTGSFTLEAWAKHSAIATNPDYLITKADTTNGGYKMYMDASGNYCFAIDDDASWTPDDSACSSGTDYGDNAWHHLVGVKSTTSSITLYIDGNLAASDASLAATATLSNTNSLYIGADRDGSSNTWAGNVDDVKIYNYARSRDQIEYDYNRGRALAYYKFDECQGTTANNANSSNYAGTITPGASGNTLAGNCNSGTSTHMWNDGTTGKYNASLGFDGTDDYVTVADAAAIRFDAVTEDFSLFAWVKRTTTGEEYIISKEDADNDGYRLEFNSSNQVLCSEDTTDVTSTSTITDTNWHFIGCSITRAGNGQVYIDGKADGTATSMGSDAMATTSAITIGKQSYASALYFNGLIDEVRIFNYALSATQVKLLYNNQSTARFGPATGAP